MEMAGLSGEARLLRKRRPAVNWLLTVAGGILVASESLKKRADDVEETEELRTRKKKKKLACQGRCRCLGV